MEGASRLPSKIRFQYLYELFIWLLYVGLYKYSYYLDSLKFPLVRQNFPYPQLIIYSITATLYVIPFYRWLAPLLLRKKKPILFFTTLLLYFGFVFKLGNWLTSLVFYKLNTLPVYQPFYEYQYSSFSRMVWTFHFPDLQLAVTDLIAFVSVTFMWYAFENEQKKHLLEKDNLLLQLESLKAQLHPHFLFNTLNSIYGMSLAGNKETPSFILRLSNMMRYILYDCRRNMVPLEKDIEFLNNYITMEKTRYPESDIQFIIKGEAADKTIAPLLFIPFIENSFKHGSHRMTQHGFIHGTLEVFEKHCHFSIRNDFLTISQKSGLYGGVGIDNSKQRLLLYYPDRHQISIQNNGDTFEVELVIYF